MVPLGELVREQRKALGLTQSDLAEHLRVTNGYISRIENGSIQRPSDEKLEQLAQVLQVDVETLHAATAVPAPASLIDAVVEAVMVPIESLRASLPVAMAQAVERSTIQHIEPLRSEVQGLRVMVGESEMKLVSALVGSVAAKAIPVQEIDPELASAVGDVVQWAVAQPPDEQKRFANALTGQLSLVRREPAPGATQAAGPQQSQANESTTAANAADGITSAA